MVRTGSAVECLGDLTIGQRVARCRKARGMSQEVLAHLLGRSQSWLTKVERGERQLDRMSTILEVAHVLGVDVAEITGWTWTSVPSGDRAPTHSSFRS